MEDVQELFADEFSVSLCPWSAGITFGLRAYPPDVGRRPVVRVRMPLALAKVLALVVHRAVHQYEARACLTIELPQEILDELQIAPDDWKRQGLEGFDG